MLLCVKKITYFLILPGLFGWACPAKSEVSRFVYSEHRLPVSLQENLYAISQRHPIWSIPLGQEQKQIIRLLDFSTQENSVFYWAQTRLDQRSIMFSLSIKLEVWQKQQLMWQDTQTVTRTLRLMGPELRGTGQASINNLSLVPEGLLTRIGLNNKQKQEIQTDLFEQALYQLNKNYQRHNNEF